MQSELGKLFIGGISSETNQDRLREYFSTLGGVGCSGRCDYEGSDNWPCWGIWIAFFAHEAKNNGFGGVVKFCGNEILREHCYAGLCHTYGLASHPDVHLIRKQTTTHEEASQPSATTRGDRVNPCSYNLVAAAANTPTVTKPPGR
ncbi:hypothetical protein Dimus_002226 [Dionaea muscipula]